MGQESAQWGAGSQAEHSQQRMESSREPRFSAWTHVLVSTWPSWVLTLVFLQGQDILKDAGPFLRLSKQVSSSASGRTTPGQVHNWKLWRLEGSRGISRFYRRKCRWESWQKRGRRGGGVLGSPVLRARVHPAGRSSHSW